MDILHLVMPTDGLFMLVTITNSDAKNLPGSTIVWTDVFIYFEYVDRHRYSILVL